MRFSIVILLALAAACGGDDDGGGGADGGALTLTSPDIDQDGAFPIENTCDGADVSPALSWSGGPEGAAGYGIALVDNTEALIHSVIWDIPASASSVPANIEKSSEPDDPAGAKQSLAFDGATRGWLGPCPPETHDYTIYLYAVDEHPLPGVDLDTTRAPLVSALESSSIAMAELRASYQPQ
jgi:Raf kinase inhibitor-like YbhB/YbcL family protein